MSRLRHFQIDVLDGEPCGAIVPLPPGEAHHIRVLRLPPGTEITLSDGEGMVARARLMDDLARVMLLEEPVLLPASQARPRLCLATAWPKGKRAAFLVEKAAELGVAEIVPIRWARSVVVKADDSSGLERLARVAVSAAKQSGQARLTAIRSSCGWDEFLRALPPQTFTVLLDPQMREPLLRLLQDLWPGGVFADVPAVVLCVGPEGGLAPAELEAADRAGLCRASLGQAVLRVETAALAACAATASWLEAQEQG